MKQKSFRIWIFQTIPGEAIRSVNHSRNQKAGKSYFSYLEKKEKRKTKTTAVLVNVFLHQCTKRH